MRVCLFEDSPDKLEPLTLTRPAFDLLCGMSSLGQKQLRHFGATSCGMIVRPGLVSLTQMQHPSAAVNDHDWLEAAKTILVNGRWLPPAGRALHISEPCVGMFEDELAFAVVPEAKLHGLTPANFGEFLDRFEAELPQRAVSGRMIRYPWDLVEHNGDQIRNDFAVGDWAEPDHQEIAVVGATELLWVDPSARVDPFVVADTTSGPVIIDRQALVTAFTRLEGPCYIGPGTQVHGAKIRAGTTLGPQCRIGGEVEASIVHGHSNKHHDGFLGHSYVGEWVNLGAGTHNSDLRNDYGEVTVTIHGERVPTGLSKVGCFLGDHTKTGLGTLLNTGTNTGVFCNLLPAGRFAPKHVPSFSSWWNGRLQESVDMELHLRTAQIVMKRRGQVLTEAHIELYQALLRETAGERREALRDSELRTLRRSA
ncbi:MAG: hypothetical protein HY040_11585 [Planctomycetes bacterium]|nr:hypothetical protein [Planctomycetota bacterium]